MLISDFIYKLQMIQEKHGDLLITLPFLTEPLESLRAEISETEKSVSGKQVKTCWFVYDNDEVDLMLEKSYMSDDDVLDWKTVDCM